MIFPPLTAPTVPDAAATLARIVVVAPGEAAARRALAGRTTGFYRRDEAGVSYFVSQDVVRGADEIRRRAAVERIVAGAANGPLAGADRAFWRSALAASGVEVPGAAWRRGDLRLVAGIGATWGVPGLAPTLPLEVAPTGSNSPLPALGRTLEPVIRVQNAPPGAVRRAWEIVRDLRRADAQEIEAILTPVATRAVEDRFGRGGLVFGDLDPEAQAALRGAYPRRVFRAEDEVEAPRPVVTVGVEYTTADGRTVRFSGPLR